MPGPTAADIAAIKHCGQHSWDEIGAYFGLTGEAARGRYRRADAPIGGDCPICMNLNNGTASFRVDGNYAEASALGATTQEELLERCRVDTSVWRVEKWGVKEWQVGAKVKEGHLEWSDGRMNGFLDYLGLKKEDLASTWARFVRIEPEPLTPTVRPVVCNIERAFREPAPALENEAQCSLIVADPQFGFSREIASGQLDPFHDRLALDVALQLARVLQPDRIDFLGDIMDFVNWTDRFLRSPRYEYTTQPAILEAHWWIRQFCEAAPGASVSVHAGNHDDRMRRQIMTHLRHAYGLRAADEMGMPPALSPQRLLGLDSLGVRWIGDWPNDLDWINDDLMLYHGERTSQQFGGMARLLFDRYSVSVVFAHNHRSELSRRTMYHRGGSRVLTAYSPGCVCRVDGAVPSKTKRENWQQGVGIIRYTASRFDIQDILFQDGAAIFEDGLISGRDRVAELQEDLPEWRW